MAGKFRWMMFKDVNLCDDFFAPLKADYKDFSIWFKKKSDTGEKALVFHDEIGVGAFVYLKLENESIVLSDRILPSIPRLKIGTLRLAERFRGKRFGEGALGVSLWYWQNTKTDEVYITTYEKHTDLIYLLKRFGFVCAGKTKTKNLYLSRTGIHLITAIHICAFHSLVLRLRKQESCPSTIAFMIGFSLILN